MAILRARLGLDTVVYDTDSAEIHLLNPTAAWLLEVGDAPVVDLVALIIDEFGTDPASAEHDIRSGLRALSEIGLAPGSSDPQKTVEDTERPSDRCAPSRPNLHHGRPLSVLDQTIVFRSPDTALLRDVDDLLGIETDLQTPVATDHIVFFEIVPDSSGAVTLLAADRWDFPDRGSLLAQLPGVLHDHAAHNRGLTVFHAGSVRTPDGDVIIIPGQSTAGKSTLTAALIRAGSDLISEEMTGVLPGSLAAIGYATPLNLDARSRAVLGLHQSDSPLTSLRELRRDARIVNGPTDPVNRIVLPDFFHNAEVEVHRPVGIEALLTLLPHAVNLLYAGNTGFQTICDLVQTVPVHRIRHGDSVALARQLLNA